MTNRYNKNNGNRLPQLDGLRGLFSVLVAAHHFALYYNFKGNLLSFFLLREADLFVDFFFVLSGFVIGMNYCNSLNSFSDFKKYMYKRFLRLYPLLFYTVLVFFIFQVTTNLVWPQLLNNTQTLSTLVIQTADSLLFTNSTRLITSGPGMNYPSWSISAEMISYFTFGIIMFVAPKHKNFVFAFIFLLAAISLYALGFYRQTSAWGFLRGITCFITGCYAFLLYSKNRYRNISKYWEPAIIIFLVGILYLFQFIISFMEQLTLLTIPATFGTAVYIFSLGRGRLSTWLCSYPLQWLGKISYSIYLNHAIVLIIVWKLVFVVAKIPVTDFTLSLMLIFYISVVLIYSYITYTVIERRFKHHVNSNL